MKKIGIKLVFTTIILFSFFILGFNQAKAQFPDCSTLNFPACYDQNCDNPTDWWTGFEDVEFPEWPGCTLHVTYCARQCGYPPHETQWSINGVWVWSAECAALINWITNNGSGFDQTKWRDLKLKIVRKISTDYFIDWYEQAPQWAKDRVRCGSGYHEKVTYWEASCLKTCSVTQIINGTPHYVITQVPCIDVNYCCGVSYKYCMDDHGQVVTEETLVGHVVNCYVSPYPDPAGCPPGIDLEVSFCSDNCLLQ